MPTRNVVLTDQQENFVNELVSSGRYQNASEAVRDGVRLLQTQTELKQAELEAIRAGVIEGLAQLDRGEYAAGSGREAVERAFAEALDQKP